MDRGIEDAQSIFNIRGKALHPLLIRRVVSLYTAGRYEEAVLNSFKVVEERLRVATGSQEVGVDLVSTAFKPSSGALIDPNAWEAEREGLHLFFRGAFLAFRNPSGHRFIEMDTEQAFDLIVLANRLLLIVEAAEQRVRAQGIVRPVLLPARQQGQL